MAPSARLACPRCGTAYAEDATPTNGERVCLKCLFSLARQTPAELEDAQQSEMKTLSGSAVAAPDEKLSFTNYEVLGFLGNGGMGIVYKARQKGLDRIVALKVLLRGVADDEEGIQRFLNEARSAARLQHPHIVSIHEVSSDEGRLFFSMEYVEGKSLGAWVAEPGRTFPEIADCLRKVALAIEHAHDAGIIHRDLKPPNILIGRDGNPKVTDFGIAKDVNTDARITKSGVAIGTPSSMAPEQAAGESEKIGPRTDVYALGAVLYECLARRPPFNAGSVTETMRQVVTAEPVSPRTLNPDVPRALEAICLRAMQKDPERRYASALAFSQDLSRYLEGQPVRARKSPRWRIAGGILIVLGLGAVYLARPGQPVVIVESAADQLGRKIRESRGDERKRAAASLQELGREGVPVWRRLLADADPDVRWRAAEALGDLKARETIPDLLKALRDPDLDVGRRAADALINLGAQGAAPEIVKLLEDSNAGLRRRAIRLLGKLKARQAVAPLVALLKSDESRARESATVVLGQMEAREAAGALEQMLTDETTSVRQAALAALVELEARDRHPAIVRLLRDEDAAIRESAASALGKLGAREAIPELTRVQREDSSSGVRDAAEQALKDISSQGEK